jgi:integrase
VANHNIWKSPGGALFFKLGIPRGLRDRPEFRSRTGKPKTKITEPLGTYDPTEARAIRDQKLAYWKRVFARMTAGVALDAEDLAAEAERIRVETLATLRAPPTEWQKREAELAHAEELLRRQRQIVEGMRGLLAEVKAGITSVAERHGLALEEGSPLYQDIGRTVFAAIERATNEYADAEMFTASPSKPVQTSNGGERFSVAFEHYITWLKDKQKARPLTIQDYTTRARRFIEFAGDPKLEDVSIDAAQAFLDDIAKTKSAGTVNLHHVVCKAVFEHARNERHRFTGHNPFSFKSRKHKARSKSKYTLAELNQFFASPLFVERQIKPAGYSVNSALPWVFAIGLFSGLTLEEACQLRPQDIRKEAGEWIIAVTAAAAVSGELKRAARERTVPLHPALIRLGLLEYVAARPKGERWIFPGLSETKQDKRGDPVGKAFNRWRRKLGIERPGETLDFHSLRHTFGKAIEDHGLTSNDCARLMGRAVRGITASVYSAPELKRVAPLLARVTWDGLRLPD